MGETVNNDLPMPKNNNFLRDDGNIIDSMVRLPLATSNTARKKGTTASGTRNR